MSNESTDHTSWSPDRQSRRRWLKLVGTTGIAGLAGCSGGPSDESTEGEPETETPDQGGDSTQTTDESGTPEMVDQIWTAQFRTQPTKAQWNPYNSNNQASYGWETLFMPLAWFSTKANEFVPFILHDWEWVEDSKRIRLHVADFWTWHNGDPVTARDVATKLKLEKYLGALGDTVETVTVKDEGTVDVVLAEEIANVLFELQLFSRASPKVLDTPHSVYGDMLETIENTEPDTDARDKALGEVVQFQFQPPIGTGPWKQKEAQNSRIVLEPHDDYPFEALQQQIVDSDHIEYEFPSWAQTSLNHSEAHFEYHGDSSGAVQSWITNKTDAGPGTLDRESAEQYPDTVTMTPRPSYRGSCLCFQLDHPIYGRPEVRRAFAYAMDVQSMADTTYALNGFANTTACGLPEALAKQLLSENFRTNTLTSYVQQDFEAARAEMQSLVGSNSAFSQSNGVWTYEGEPITVTISAPAVVSAHINSMRKMKSYLEQAGFKAEVRGVEGVSFWTKTMPEGDWTVAQNYFGGAQPHPYFAFWNTWLNGFLLNGVHNPPSEVTVPPIGESSGEMTVQVAELTKELGSNISEERQQEIVEKLSWTWNQSLPYVPYAERHNAWTVNMARFNYAHPEDKAQSLQINPYFQHALGLAPAREEPRSSYPYDKRYQLSIKGESVDGGMTLEESKNSMFE